MFMMVGRKFNERILLVLLIITGGLLQGSAPWRYSSDVARADSQSGSRELAPNAGRPWYLEPFTVGNDTYAKTRSEIDKSISKGQSVEKLQEMYWDVARNAPDDSLAQFAWSYAVSRHLDEINNAYTRHVLEEKCVSRLLKPVNPSAYDYERLLYIYSSMLGYSPNLREVGDRLLAQSKGDTEVLYQYMRNLPPSTADDKLIDHYCAVLLSSRPNDPNPYAVVGNYYWTRLQMTGQLVYGDKSISAFQKYLDTAPKTADYRPDATYDLTSVRELMTSIKNNQQK